MPSKIRNANAPLGAARLQSSVGLDAASGFDRTEQELLKRTPLEVANTGRITLPNGLLHQPSLKRKSRAAAASTQTALRPFEVEIYTGDRSQSDDEQVTKARWKIGGRVYDSPLMETAEASEFDNAVIVEEVLNTYGVYALLDQNGLVTIAVISSADELYPRPEGWGDLTLNRGGPYNLGTEEAPEWGFAKRIVLFGDVASINDVTSNLSVASACSNGEVRPTIISI